MDNLLKTKRLEKKMTLEDVAKIVGVGKSTVRKWENGLIENMGRDKIVSLSKALNISPLAILGVDNVKQSETDDLKKELDEIFNSLNKEKQEIVKEKIRQLIDYTKNGKFELSEHDNVFHAPLIDKDYKMLYGRSIDLQRLLQSSGELKFADHILTPEDKCKVRKKLVERFRDYLKDNPSKDWDYLPDDEVNCKNGKKIR